MSKICDMINKMCPNGVSFITIGDAFNLFSGMTGVSNKWAENGNCQFIDYMNVYKNNKVDVKKLPFATVKNLKQNVLEKGDILLTSASETPEECAISSVIEQDINNGIFMDDHLFGLRLKNEYKNRLNPTFVSYYFNSYPFRCNLSKAVRGVTRFYISNAHYLKMLIPVPPIEIQEEIVRILDKFGELEAELEARKSQYEFWRGKIFDIKGETKTYKLEEVLKSLKTGLNPRKFFRLNTEDADGYYVTVREIGDRNVRYWESKDRVNRDGLLRINERANLEIGDVLFSGTGTIGRVSLIEETPDNWNVKEGVYILKPKKEIINPVYLMHLMRSDYMKKLYSDYIVGSPVSSVPMRDLKNVEFELPDLETQERISNILDKFDKLINDITVGLPAEIELRRKQYEYYRNKLLSFEELSISE